jgi:RNA polymerase sigma factor (sigma-70 family)
MNEPEQPGYLVAYEQIRDDFREEVLERATDQLISEGFPPSALLASHLLVGAYFERQGSERVRGEPRDPDQIHTIRGINLTRTRVGELTVRLAEVTFLEERRSDKEEPYIDASNDLTIFSRQLRNVPPMTGERLESAISRLEVGRKAEAALERGEAGGIPLRQGTVDRLREEAAARQKAIGELAESYLPYGVKVAKQLQGRGLDLEDLIGSAAENLLHLAAQWEPSTSSFYTYIKASLSWRIIRDIDNMGKTIRIPLHVSDDTRALARGEQALAQKRIEPTDEMVAQETGWEVEKVRNIRETRRNLPRTSSLVMRDETELLPEEKDDNDFRDASGKEYHPPADTELEMQGIEMMFVRKAIQLALETLPYREREIIRLKFGLTDSRSEPMTHKEIGKVFGVSGNRIGQIEQAAMRKLRHSSKRDILRGFLGASREY